MFVDGSTILQLPTAVTEMTETLEALSKKSERHSRKIKHMRAVQLDSDVEELFSNNKDDSDKESGNRTNRALVRGTLKGSIKRRKK